MFKYNLEDIVYVINGNSIDRHKITARIFTDCLESPKPIIVYGLDDNVMPADEDKIFLSYAEAAKMLEN